MEPCFYWHDAEAAQPAQANDAEKKMKLPINESTNFSIIINQHPPNRERDAHFLISVRKSKKDRKGEYSTTVVGRLGSLAGRVAKL